MARDIRVCPDCASDFEAFNRRDFLRATGAAAIVAGALPAAALRAAEAPKGDAETAVKLLYQSLNDAQKKAVCYDWDYMDPKRGHLRTMISNNWHINEQVIGSDFYTNDQKRLIRDVFEGIFHPDWHARIDHQLDDDAGGYGKSQNIAIFGQPGQDKFEFVMTGRHMTIRCDGNSTDYAAFGGPIFYGHAANGKFDEPADHPDNIFWPQALEANKVFTMLDGKQRALALIENLPKENAVGFRASGRPGISLTELSRDQLEHVHKVLSMLVEPYRQSDRDEVIACLKAQGGLEKCSLAFFKEGDLGNDSIWDCWRLEGPSFVWYFRGEPHVHVWVNVASDAQFKINPA